MASLELRGLLRAGEDIVVTQNHPHLLPLCPFSEPLL
jgi:hypothetical protein